MAALPPLPPPEQHRLAQAGLTVAAEQALTRAWGSLDVRNLKATLPEFKRQVAAVIRHFSPASGVLANRNYTKVRSAAEVPGRFTPTMADPAPLEQIGATVDWATSDLWVAEPDLEAAQVKLDGAAARMILDVGRTSTIENVEADRTAIAWAREAKPDACWFCAMLAARGAVYTSAEAAGAVPAGENITVLGMATNGDAKGFVNRYHNACRCTVVPVFNRYEQTAQSREWARLWNESTAHVTGMKPKQQAFAAALAASRGQ